MKNNITEKLKIYYLRRMIYGQIKFLALLIMFSFLLPSVKIGGFGMKLDLIFLFPLLAIIWSVDNKIKKSILFKKVGFIAFLLFLNMLISDVLGVIHYEYASNFYFPTEYIQIFGRVCAFYIFYFIGYTQIIKKLEFNKNINIIFLLALTFGFLQSLDISIINKISAVYALSEVQLSGFESIDQRGFGVAGNIITWGGVSGLMFYYFYYLVGGLKYKIIGCCLAILNITLSASRSAIISLIVSFVLVNLIIAIFIEKKISSIVKVVFAISAIFVSVFYTFINFLPQRYELIMNRFSYMEDSLKQSGRGAQREFFISFMNTDYWNYVFGIGKPTLDSLGYMEMEPVFLIVAYGIVGFALHYTLLSIYIKEAFKIRNNEQRAFRFIIASTIFYLVFSLGFFFMRESYCGLIYWILIGYILGSISNHLKTKQHEIYN